MIAPLAKMTGLSMPLLYPKAAYIWITLEEGAATAWRLQVERETLGRGALQLGMRVQAGGDTEALPNTIWRVASYYDSCLVCGRAQLGVPRGHVRAQAQGHPATSSG